MSGAIDDPWTYVVTDIETDGPWYGAHSMRSFASVAVTARGEVLGEFEAVLAPLPGSTPDPATYAWFQAQPEVWAAATSDARPPGDVMSDFVTWVRSLPGPRTFAANPLIFDGVWIDHYLRRYTAHGVLQGHYEQDLLFDGPALCLRSYAAAVTGLPVADASPAAMPQEWLGGVEHTHRAIDDARGYAHLLRVLFARVREER